MKTPDVVFRELSSLYRFWKKLSKFRFKKPGPRTQTASEARKSCR